MLVGQEVPMAPITQYVAVRMDTMLEALRVNID